MNNEVGKTSVSVTALVVVRLTHHKRRKLGRAAIEPSTLVIQVALHMLTRIYTCINLRGRKYISLPEAISIISVITAYLYVETSYGGDCTVVRGEVRATGRHMPSRAFLQSSTVLDAIREPFGDCEIGWREKTKKFMGAKSWLIGQTGSKKEFESNHCV